MLILCDAKPQFQESKHPRDPDGKFASGGGAGGVEKYEPNPWFKSTFKKNGYDKVHDTDLPTFYNKAHNTKIVLHPPKSGAAKATPSFIVEGPNGVSKMGKGPTDLIKHLADIGALKKNTLGKKNSAANVTAKPKQPEKHQTEADQFESAAKSLGFANATLNGTKTDFFKPNGQKLSLHSDGSWCLYSTTNFLMNIGSNVGEFKNFVSKIKPNLTKMLNLADQAKGWKLADVEFDIYNYTDEYGRRLSISAFGDYWAMYDEDNEEIQQGTTPESLQSWLQSTGAFNDTNGSPVDHSDDPDSPQNAATSVLQKLGFTEGTSEEFMSDLYEKGETKIKVDSNGEWIASTPGFSSKTGTGAESLEMFLTQKGKFQGTPPWKTTNQNAGPEPEKADPTAAELKEKKETALGQLLKDTAPIPTPKQKEALQKYTGSGYKYINGTLRKTNQQMNADPVVQHLDEYVMAGTIPEDCTLYRKVSGEYAQFLCNSLENGFKFTDRGFISSSNRETSWSGDLKMIISVAKGSKGASVKGHSQHPGEDEILLPRGSRFVVDKIGADGKTMHVTLDQSHMAEAIKSEGFKP